MTRRMYSSIDGVTEMTSGNLVHGSCMVNDMVQVMAVMLSDLTRSVNAFV